MNRTFVSAFACLLISFSLIYVIFLGLGKHDLDPSVIKDERLHQVRTTLPGLCIQETICRRQPTDSVYEYQRDGLFLQKIESKAKSNAKVITVLPRIIHFARFRGEKTYFRFHELLAVMAAQKVMTSSIYIWYDYLPFGENWKKMMDKPLNIFLVHRMIERNNTDSKSLSIFEETVRCEAVLEFGGIGLDFDILLLQSLNQFFQHDVTMGMVSNSISSSVVIAKPLSPFMLKWYIMNSKTNHKSPSNVIGNIAKRHKDLLHIVPELITPSNKDLAHLYEVGRKLQWRKTVICMKLWFTAHGVEHGEHDIKGWNTTAGEIFRYIYGKQ